MFTLKHRRFLLAAISILLLAFSIVYIGKYVQGNVHGLYAANEAIPFSLILLSLMITLVAHCWNGCLWWYSLRIFNTPVNTLEAYRAWTISRLARYIPGKVFSYFVRYGLHHRQHRTGITLATIAEIVCTLLATIMIGLIALIYYTDQLNIDIKKWLFVLVPVCFIVIPLLIAASPYLLKKINVPLELDSYNFKFSAMLKLSLLQLPLHLIHGMAFFVVLKASSGVDWYWFIYVVTVYYLSGLIGQLAVLAPAGLGVREASLLALLAPVLGEQAGLLYAVILIRLIIVASEIINALFATCLYRLSLPTQPSQK